MKEHWTVVFPLYPGVTHLDFTGPHQFLARLPGARLIVASIEAQPISADGLVFSGLADLESIDQTDILCVPGGVGCAQAANDERFLAAIRRLAQEAQYVTSVCTGSLILGAAGLLKGRRAACHWAWKDFLPLFGAIPDPARVVRDGRFVTGGGVTAGIDFALSLIEELAGTAVAQSIQLGLEYSPDPPFDAGHPDRAPVGLTQAYLARMAPLVEERRRAFVKAAQ